MTYMLKNGDVLEKEEISVKFNCNGQYFNENGILIYEGSFRNGMYHKIGTLFFEDGTILYKGSFKNGLYHGNGILYYKNKNIQYSGMFREGKYNGNGILYSNIGKIQYKGNWKKGKKNGKGIQYHSNGEIMYNGSWKNDYWQGYGLFYTFEGKKIYEGNFRLSLRHGYGTYFDDPQVRYVGNWRNDFPYGQGTSFFRNGNIEYEGKWKQGYRHGRGCLYFKEDGKLKQKGKWKNDIFLEDSQSRKKIRGEILIQTFLETKNQEILKEIPPRFIRSFLEKKEISFSKFSKKKYLIQKLIQYHKVIEKEEKDSFDLFGNEILIPVKGSDGEIYDKSSMEYLFQKDKEGKFINIPYIYNQFNIPTPNFPVMANGKHLYSFSLF